MSEEFFRVARQEIQDELKALELAIASCGNDACIFENSREIKGHFHKIKGLAPMIGETGVGEIAGIADVVLGHVVRNGSLSGSFAVIARAIGDMARVQSRTRETIVSDLKKMAREMLPQVTGF